MFNQIRSESEVSAYLQIEKIYRKGRYLRIILTIHILMMLLMLMLLLLLLMMMRHWRLKVYRYELFCYKIIIDLVVFFIGSLFFWTSILRVGQISQSQIPF